jgi:hypothetical protein
LSCVWVRKILIVIVNFVEIALEKLQITILVKRIVFILRRQGGDLL